MLKKTYLHLLILCGIWSQRIIGTYADEEIKESTDLLVRQKRVINRIPDEDKAVSIKSVPYIAYVKYLRRAHCVGSILSHYIIITSAMCVQNEAAAYTVVFGTSRSNSGNNFRDLIEIRRKYGIYTNRPLDGIALLIVRSSIEFGVFSHPINLYSGPLQPNMIGTISGWGYNCAIGAHRETVNPNHLRTIQVPIMDHQDCVNIYRPYHLHITDQDICTYHTHRYCGHSDGGAPLVVDGYLAGVRLRSGLTGQQDSNYPDVFVMLQHPQYNSWIITNIDNVHLQLRQQHL